MMFFFLDQLKKMPENTSDQNRIDDQFDILDNAAIRTLGTFVTLRFSQLADDVWEHIVQTVTLNHSF